MERVKTVNINEGVLILRGSEQVNLSLSKKGGIVKLGNVCDLEGFKKNKYASNVPVEIGEDSLSGVINFSHLKVPFYYTYSKAKRRNQVVFECDNKTSLFKLNKNGVRYIDAKSNRNLDDSPWLNGINELYC